MKKIMVILTMGIFLSCGPVFGFWIGDVASSANTFTAFDAMGFDWSSSGSGLAVDLGPYGTAIPDGTEFDFLYQAKLVDLTDQAGDSLKANAVNDSFFSGLNSDFEYTVVAYVPEVLLTTIPVPGSPDFPYPNTAYFQTAPGGSFYIMYDDADSVVTSGENFADGTIVASGTIGAGQLSQFTAFYPPTADTDAFGNGSFTFFGDVTYANSAYLDLADLIMGFRAEGTLNYLPLDSSTSAFFDGTNDTGNTDYASFTVTSDDLLLKADASSKFLPVPEPSTFVLLGCGLLGVGIVCRKKKNS